MQTAIMYLNELLNFDFILLKREKKFKHVDIATTNGVTIDKYIMKIFRSRNSHHVNFRVDVCISIMLF